MGRTNALLATFAIEGAATEVLLPLVYDELRQLASGHLVGERTDISLQATALVHEAYLRLVAANPFDRDTQWDNRPHFFAAASEAMRRILVDHARKKLRLKREGNRNRLDLSQVDLEAPVPSDEVIAVHELLHGLEAIDPFAARLVKLRYFMGCTIPEAAEILGVSPRKVNQVWAYARAWMLAEIEANAELPATLPT